MNYGDPVTVPPGAQIAIKNNDSVEHSVTSDAAGKFTVDVDGNEEGTLTAPSEPGEYAFHCKYHPSMFLANVRASSEIVPRSWQRWM